MYQIGDYQ